jgi:hypothetical protein
VEGVHCIAADTQLLTNIPVYIDNGAHKVAKAYLERKGKQNVYCKAVKIYEQPVSMAGMSVWREASLHCYLQRLGVDSICT